MPHVITRHQFTTSSTYHDYVVDNIIEYNARAGTRTLNNEYMEYLHWLFCKKIDSMPADALLVQLRIINALIMNEISLSTVAYKSQSEFPKITRNLNKLSSEFNSQLAGRLNHKPLAIFFPALIFAMAVDITVAFLLSPLNLALYYFISAVIGSAIIGGLIGARLGHAVHKWLNRDTKAPSLNTTIESSMLKNDEHAESQEINNWVQTEPAARATVKTMFLTRYNLNAEGLETSISDLNDASSDNNVDLSKLSSVLSR